MYATSQFIVWGKKSRDGNWYEILWENGMKGHAFLIFSASLLIAVIFGSRQILPLTISGIQSDLAIDYLSISLAFAVGQVVSGVANPLGGVVADKFGYHRAMYVGVILSIVGFSLIPFSFSPLLLVFAVGVLSSFGAGFAGIQVAMSAINKKIPPEKSGFAFGVINAGGSAGQFIMAPIAGFIIVNFGWTALLYALIVTFFLIIPFCWVLRSDASIEQKQNEDNFTLLETLNLASKTPSFILLILGFFTCGFHVAFVITHMPGVIEVCGLAPTVAGWSLAFIGFFNILGSLLAGWYISRWSMKNFLSAIYFIRAVIVVLFLLSGQGTIAILMFSAALGFTYLSTVPPTAALVGKMFGPKFMATLFGITLLSHQVGAFLGAYLGGYFFTNTGSYEIVWIIDILLAVFAAVVHLPIKEKRVNFQMA